MTCGKFSGAPGLPGGVVMWLRLDPAARALIRQMPLLLERRRESLAAMQARGDDENDSLAWPDQTIPVHGEDRFERPAGGRLLRNAVDLGLRYAGISHREELLSGRGGGNRR